MRKIAFAVICFSLSNMSIAQSDYNVRWSISGVQGVTEMSADINVGTQYLSSNGGVTLTNGNTVPVVGTCFFTNNDGVFCTFSYQQGETVVLDLGPTISGAWRTTNVLGNVVETGTATVVNMR